MYKNEFYNMEDIKRMTKFSKSTAYKLIADLNEILKQENPGIVTFKGKILKSVWDKQFKTREGDENEK